MLKEHIFIVFGIEHYNPLGIIRSLGEWGIRPIFIAIPGRAKVASCSKYISKCHYVKDFEEGCRLLLDEYGNYPASQLPFVITSDDEQVSYMDEHYAEYKDRFIFFNAGKSGRITEFMDKYKVLQLAKKHGLKILDTQIAERGNIPKGLQYPIITKSILPIVGGWKSDVHICNSEEELKKAYETIESPIVVHQKYIEKKNELCLDGFSVAKGKGMFIAIASTYNYQIPGYYSPYMTVRNFTDSNIEAALQSMMAEIGFEGIFSIEFLIDQDGSVYFSEINFRNSTWSYAATCAGMPLPILWAEAMLTGTLRKDAYKAIQEDFTAMVEPIDYAKRVKTGKITEAEWLFDFKRARCGFYHSPDDKEPFMEMMRNFDLLG